MGARLSIVISTENQSRSGSQIIISSRGVAAGGFLNLFLTNNSVLLIIFCIFNSKIKVAALESFKIA